MKWRKAAGLLEEYRAEAREEEVRCDGAFVLLPTVSLRQDDCAAHL